LNKSEYSKVGFIKKPFGYKGEMIFAFEFEEIEQITTLSFIFFDIDNELVPFYIEEIDFRDKKIAICKVEDINSSDDSKKFTGCFLYLPSKDLQLKASIKPSFENLVAYQAIDKVLGPIGSITEVVSLPEQELLNIDYQGKEILIPAVEAFIFKVDDQNREVHLQLPDGLIDL